MRKIGPIFLFLVAAFLAGLASPYYAGGQGTTTVVGGAGGNPGGANTQIQFNNNGSFSGSSTLVANPAGTVLTVSPATNQVGLSVQVPTSSQTVPSFQVLAHTADVLFGVQESATAYRMTIGGTVGAFFHVVQGQANPDFAGVVTCVANAATKTFSGGFTSTPVILLFDETTKGGVNLTAKSATAFTVSCTGATDVVDYLTIGNPN